MMLVTYLPRMLPLVILSKVNIPPLVLRWLKFIPVAVLSALLGPEILMGQSGIDFSRNNIFLLAAVPSFLIAYKTKNLFYTVFTGMGIVVLLSRIMV